MGEANTEVKMITIALEDEKEEQKSSDEESERGEEKAAS